jgi:hypothetical protein
LKISLAKVRPAIRSADITNRAPGEAPVATENKVNIASLGMKERSINQIQPTDGIIRAVSLKMGSQKRKEPQLSAQALIHYFQPMMDQQRWMMGIGQDVFRQSVTPAPLRICQFVEKSFALRHFDFVMKVALFFMAEGFAIRDE